MKTLNGYTNVILSIIYLLWVRYAVKLGWLEINSMSYLIVTPIILGFIPFFMMNKPFHQSIAQCIIFPVLSTLLFLTISVMTGIEDLLCFIIIGFPFIIISIIVSLLLRRFKFKQVDKSLHTKYLLLFLLPFLTNGLENVIEKTNRDHRTETSLIINAKKEKIWHNLHAVPNLSKYTTTSFLNQIGIPKPLHSEYDPVENVRLGYFDNGIILNEKVIEEKKGRKLSFSIDFEKSTIKNSPTIENAIKEKSIQFEKISYELIPINQNKTIVKLICQYKVRSNLQFYGSYLANSILSDFESNLLKSLKSTIENNQKKVIS